MSKKDQKIKLPETITLSYGGAASCNADALLSRLGDVEAAASVAESLGTLWEWTMEVDGGYDVHFDVEHALAQQGRAIRRLAHDAMHSAREVLTEISDVRRAALVELNPHLAGRCLAPVEDAA